MNLTKQKYEKVVGRQKEKGMCLLESVGLKINLSHHADRRKRLK
jgi:hypothetical protein